MKALWFALGAVCGASGAYYYCKKRYDSKISKEVESISEAFKKANAENTDLETAVNAAADAMNDFAKAVGIPEKKSIDDLDPVYAGIVQKAGYTSYGGAFSTQQLLKPYLISEDEFGDTGFRTEYWTFYSDGILTDSSDEIVDAKDIPFFVGEEVLAKFTEQDIVHVRNPVYKRDYEITFDKARYGEDQDDENE